MPSAQNKKEDFTASFDLQVEKKQGGPNPKSVFSRKKGMRPSCGGGGPKKKTMRFFPSKGRVLKSKTEFHLTLSRKGRPPE